jgi:uncharacterized membrane protein YcaP (DUF421 family)
MDEYEQFLEQESIAKNFGGLVMTTLAAIFFLGAIVIQKTMDDSMHMIRNAMIAFAILLLIGGFLFRFVGLKKIQDEY